MDPNAQRLDIQCSDASLLFVAPLFLLAVFCVACFLRGIRILVDLVADSLHKIARGRGTSKGADNGHLPTTNALI